MLAPWVTKEEAAIAPTAPHLGSDPNLRTWDACLPGALTPGSETGDACPSLASLRLAAT